jgi:hypothetical protein
MPRAGVERGDESLEYKDGGEEDSKDARKEGNDGKANESFQFAFPPRMAVDEIRATIFDANGA